MRGRARIPWTLGALLVVGCGVAAGCGKDGMGPDAPGSGTTVRLTVAGLPSLDPSTDGVYRVWAVGPEAGLVGLGAVEGAAAATGVELDLPLDDPDALFVTVEPPGRLDDGTPSQLKVLGGRFQAGLASLELRGYLTPNLDLEAEPGQHVLGTHAHLLGGEDAPPQGPGDPREAGVWLHNDGPTADTLDGSFYVTLTPLTQGWTYEGWVVRDLGTPGAVWLSYGKFAPGPFRKVRSRDDTGLGVFSGWEDYELTLPRTVFFPGDDWLANPLDRPVPGGVELPLDLNGCLESEEACAAAGSAYGPSRWSHVITVEPWEDRREDPLAARPFFLRPYRNAIGEAPPDDPRTLRLRSGELPSGTAEIVVGQVAARTGRPVPSSPGATGEPPARWAPGRGPSRRVRR